LKRATDACVLASNNGGMLNRSTPLVRYL